MVAPPRTITAIALPPGWPSRLPSISRPKLSWSPAGGSPSTSTWIVVVRDDGFLRVSVTVRIAGL